MNLGKQIASVDYRNNFLISIAKSEQKVNNDLYRYVHNWDQWVELNWFVDIFNQDFRVWI